MEKIFCHDCKKAIQIEGEEIKNGVNLVYKKGKQDISVFKCSDCYSKDKSLNNFQECEVYSRVVGYLRPVQQWNEGKQEEFNQRKEYKT